MLLHTVSASPFSSPRFTDAVKACLAGDALLLMGDAVYAAAKAGEIAVAIDSKAAVAWFVIEEDCQIRGLVAEALHSSVKSIDYKEFVELVIAADSTIAW